MMNKTKAIIRKLGSVIFNLSNRKYTAYSRVANPSQPEASQNKMGILTYYGNYSCF